MAILIADDEDLDREILEHTLTQAGYDVIAVGSGTEALECVRQGLARLVISDWEMPGLTGPELCEAIRREPIDGYVYTMLLTSHSKQDEIVQGLNAGADDFLTKPFNPAELIVRIRAGMRILSLETRDLAMFALAKLAESRDSETGQHIERVQWYSRVLAKTLAENPKFKDKIDSEFISLIFSTSPLHDIGKVAIPDCILRKPGRLSDEEFSIMKSHSKLGAETLDAALERFPNARFLQMAREIAATHHERWDGSGYPAGLRGEDIPLSGRIVALADVYDALTSKRCYKESFDHVVARSILIEESGSHFDPDIVDAFLAAEDEFQEIRERFTQEVELTNRA